MLTLGWPRHDPDMIQDDPDMIWDDPDIDHVGGHPQPLPAIEYYMYCVIY